MRIPQTDVAHAGDISLFNAGGTNLICDFNNVSLTLSEKQEDGSCPGRDGEDPQGVKRSGKISIELLGNRSGGEAYERTSHIDVTSVSIGAHDYIEVLKSLEFKGEFTKFMKAGVGAWWEKPQNRRKKFSGSVVLEEGDGVAAPFLIAASSNAYGTRNTTLSIVVGGQIYALPIRMGDVQTGRGRGDEGGEITIPWTGRDPGSGAYPTTAPSGTATLFARAWSAWKTPISWAFTSKTSAGWAATGLAVFDSFGFKIEDGAFVPTSYEFSLYGKPDFSATSGT